MKKRVFALLLLAAMCCALLAGCGEKPPVEQYFSMMTELAGLEELQMQQTVHISLNADAAEELLELEDAPLEAHLITAGTLSRKNRQMKLFFSGGLSSGDLSFEGELTDLLIDGDALYLNLRKPLARMLESMGADAAAADDWLSADMLKLELGGQNDELWSSMDAQSKTQMAATALRLMKAAQQYFTETEPDCITVTKQNGVTTCTLTMDARQLAGLLTVILQDVHDNAADYYEIFSAMMVDTSGAFELVDREEFVPELQEQAEEAIAELQDGDVVPEGNYTSAISRNGSDKDYMQTFRAELTGFGTVEISGESRAAQVERFAPPEGYLTPEDVQDLIYALY